MYLVILLYVLFASLFTLQKDTLSYCEPFFLVGSRMLFAGLILLGYVMLRHKPKLMKIKPEHIKGILLLAISNIYLTNIFEIWAIQHMVSSKACLIYSLSPFVAALVAFVILKERMSRKKLLGMFIGFLGLLPIIFTQTQDELSTGTFIVFTLAELSLVGAVFCSVYGWIQLKKVMNDYEYTPLVANALSMSIGGLLALIHSYYAGENWAPIPVTSMQPYIINTLFMCLISNLICYNLYGYLLKRFTATFMSFAGLVTPIFASLFGFLFLQEVVTWHFYVSIVLFSLGLMIFYREEISQEKGFQVKTQAKAVAG
jgi:drug/metabolite transporter (DMT)-like permease